MNSRDVFPLFIDSFDLVRSTLGSNYIAEYYQSVKRTEEESGLRFASRSKQIYLGCLYIWRVRRSRDYYIGWWIDIDHDDFYFNSAARFSNWKKNLKRLLKNQIKTSI